MWRSKFGSKSIGMTSWRALSILQVLMIALFGACVAYDFIVRYPRAGAVQAQMEEILREIPAPGSAVQVRFVANHKGSQALVQASYQLPWSLDELREH